MGTETLQNLLVRQFDVSRFQIDRTTKSMFIRLIYFLLAFSNWWHIIKGRDLQIRNTALYRRK
jgi:hypothetical protein